MVAVAQFFFYSALAHLKLTTTSALSQTAATFMVLLFIALYGEKIGVWLWSEIIIGPLCALIIVRPGSDIFSWSSLFTICPAFCYTAATVIMCSFDNSISNAVLFIYSLVAAAKNAFILAAGSLNFPQYKQV